MVLTETTNDHQGHPSANDRLSDHSLVGAPLSPPSTGLNLGLYRLEKFLAAQGHIFTVTLAPLKSSCLRKLKATKRIQPTPEDTAPSSAPPLWEGRSLTSRSTAPPRSASPEGFHTTDPLLLTVIIQLPTLQSATPAPRHSLTLPLKRPLPCTSPRPPLQ